MSTKTLAISSESGFPKFSKHLGKAMINAGVALFDENGDVQGFLRIQ